MGRCPQRMGVIRDPIGIPVPVTFVMPIAAGNPVLGVEGMLLHLFKLLLLEVVVVLVLEVLLLHLVLLHVLLLHHLAVLHASLIGLHARLVGFHPRLVALKATHGAKGLNTSLHILLGHLKLLWGHLAPIDHGLHLFGSWHSARSAHLLARSHHP